MAFWSMSEPGRGRSSARLAFVDGPWCGRVVALDSDVVLMGSDAVPRAADLRFVREATSYMVQPLCADRLVTVNDRRIPSHVSAILKDGDTIAFGAAVVRFEERPAPQLMDAEKIDRLRTILQPHVPGRRRSLARSLAPIIVITLLSGMGLVAAGIRPESGAAARAAMSTQDAANRVAVNGTFHGRLAGTGRIAIPVRGTQLVIRVAVAPAAQAPGTRFWCLTSDFGLAPDAHYCGGSGVAGSPAGTNVDTRTVDVDPGWPASASYFIQAYCQVACTWDITAAPQ
jgi:hypothetical protein